jgi:hypothetical protein
MCLGDRTRRHWEDVHANVRCADSFTRRACTICEALFSYVGVSGCDDRDTLMGKLRHCRSPWIGIPMRRICGFVCWKQVVVMPFTEQGEMAL